MHIPFRLPNLRPIAVQVALEPVYNPLLSMMLLNAAWQPRAAGYILDRWVYEAAAALTPQQRHTNRLLFEALGAALLAAPDAPDVPAYLSALADEPSEQLRDRVLAAGNPLAPHEAARLLADPAAWIEQLEQAARAILSDHELLHEAHSLLQNPAVLQSLIVNHLRDLWEGVLAAEWKRRGTQLLPPTINMLNQRSFPALGMPALIRAVAGRDLPLEFAVPLHTIERLVIVPTPHVDLYATQFGNPATLWLFLAFSTVTGWTLRQSPIKPKEALARVEPLNDETRLCILELLARRGELGSQELMAALEISQPSLSRHLKALGGYITERRGEGAGKFYRLNPGQLEWSFTILRRFLAAENDLDPQATAGGPPLAPIPVNDTPLKQIRSAEAGPEAQTLRSFVNAQGRITRFPAREKEKLVVLEYLIGKFEARRSYTEKEVNALILEWITFGDFVTLRRALYDYMFLNRERDGSRYWLNPERVERTENQEPRTEN